MKPKILYILIFSAVLTFLAFSVENTEEGVKSNKDIIKFSHELHAEVTDCASCHTAVPGSEKLGERLLPEKDVCADCHDVDDDENCNMCHYEDVFEPLVQATPELIFSHKFHLNYNEDVKCESCHKGMDEYAYSSENPHSNPEMATCNQCHNDAGPASNACESCHISTANLVPENHLQSAFLEKHKFLAKSDEECQVCHNEQFCETCHTATVALDVTNSSTDFYTPYSPHKYVDNEKQQQITRVHDLNFRFTHSMEAKGKSAECATCHQTETFCAECHNPENNGDYALGGLTPTSHLGTNFVLIGLGSGGGKHAELAKRDIENCASCHDTQGADPNCIICHVDNDGIQGTNPRTHDRNFMRNVEGDWHNDRGAVCYNCHTDSNARPEGQAGIFFCGYCHGNN